MNSELATETTAVDNNFDLEEGVDGCFALLFEACDVEEK